MQMRMHFVTHGLGVDMCRESDLALHVYVIWIPSACVLCTPSAQKARTMQTRDVMSCSSNPISPTTTATAQHQLIVFYAETCSWPSLSRFMTFMHRHFMLKSPKANGLQACALGSGLACEPSRVLAATCEETCRGQDEACNRASSAATHGA